MSLILSGTDGISDVDGSASTPALRGTDANTGIFFPAADTIAFSEGGVESMRIDSSGNVGIGTASPVEKLTVAGSISTNIDLVLKQGTTDRGYIFGTSSGLFYRATSGLPHVFQNVGTELMRIDSSGNVGIGNTVASTINGQSDYANLVVGNGSSTEGITIYTGTAAEGALAFADGTSSTDTYRGLIAYNHSTNAMAFRTDATERMRIDSSGNVGVNNTSPAVIASTIQVAIKANVNGNSLFVAQNSNGLTTAKFGFQYTGGIDQPVIGSETNHPLVFLTNNTERMRVNAGAPILCLAGGNTSATGTGIAFPATQSASSDANTLDDYEEGTWTPSVGGNATYTARTANYTKVGNLVYIQCSMTINAIGTGSTAVISGLPFTSKNIGTVQAIYACYYVSIANSVTWLSGYIENNNTTIQFTGNSTAATTIQNNGFVIFGNSTNIQFSACYITS